MSDVEPMAQDEMFQDMLGDFLDESGQLLDRLNENLLRLDEWVRSQQGDPANACEEDLLNDMFRSAHSLKGLSAMLGLKSINSLTHRIENVFDAARRHELAVNGEVVELVFQGVDRLMGLVEALRDPSAEPVECESVVEGIRQLLQSAGANREQKSQADAEKAMAGAVAAAAAPSATAPAAELPAATSDTTPPNEVLSEAKLPAEAVCQAQSPAAEDPTACPLADLFEGVTDELEVSREYLSIFVDDAEMSLDQLTEALLALERQGSREGLEKSMVIAHRLKGSAAALGLNRAAKLAHLMEDLLQETIAAGRTLASDKVDALLKCVEGLRQYVNHLRHGTAGSEHFENLARALLSGPPGAAWSTSSGAPAATGAASNPKILPGPRPADDAGRREAEPCELDEDLYRRVAELAPERERVMVGRIRFERGLPLVGLKARLVYEKLAHLGQVCYFSPGPEELDDADMLDGVDFGLACPDSLDAIRSHLRIAGVAEVMMDVLDPPSQPVSGASGSAVSSKPLEISATVPLPAQARPAPGSLAPIAARAPNKPAADHVDAGQEAEESSVAAAGRGGPDSKARPAETLRVDIERLDHLMNLAGQLVINRARFSQIGDRLKTVVGHQQLVPALDRVLVALGKMTQETNLRIDVPAGEVDSGVVRALARRIQGDVELARREAHSLAGVRPAVHDLLEATHQLDRISDGIRHSVMDTRMVPIGPLFNRFKRVVRDAVRTTNKSIRLIIRGEKTELDKRMIDELGDPLIHMVRNSADHGIEPPEVRESLGKPREGTIILNAFHRGNSIFIEVSDDGKGLDAEAIRRKCREKGLVGEAELEKMTRHQLYQMIWEPGLSTAERVTEISGRGMGMNIVKSKIEDLSGTVDLNSEPGQGTSLTIKLPLTLAILPSLLVEIDGDVFAIPMEAVYEIVNVGAKELFSIRGRRAAMVRGQVIAMVSLGEVFTWRHAGRRAAAASEETNLVVIGDGKQQSGLAVDRVIGEEDIVIKSIAENYRNVPGIAGASVLGDGRVSLILDVPALLDMVYRAVSRAGRSL